MAKVTITITGKEDGDFDIDAVFDPPVLNLTDHMDIPGTHALAVVGIKAILNAGGLDIDDLGL